LTNALGIDSLYICLLILCPGLRSFPNTRLEARLTVSAEATASLAAALRAKAEESPDNSMLIELLRRISYLWNRRRLEREMAEEMAYHRELMPPDRRSKSGDDLRLREDAREIWGASRIT
jgi:hypothetical protein